MNTPLLCLLALLAAGADSSWAQTLADDCAAANTIWQKMGKNDSIPSNCCSSIGIKCLPKQNPERITEMYVYFC
jgi:hypothetical protein